jgi:SAM-dependent methyltransferase
LIAAKLWLKSYLDNSRRIWRSYNNPLKAPENLDIKDELERKFYDEEATQYLADFKEEVFLYDPDEEMPLSHKYFYSRFEKIQDKRILDIGCGHGFTSVHLAKRGGEIDSIDISPKMIELTRQNALLNKVENRIKAAVMSAQAMEFADKTFDYVVGLGILHHLNLDLAGKEISRVLKPGGRATFLEPRIPLKFLIFVRGIFPNKCFESPGGSQLTDEEVERFSSNFSDCRIDYFLFLRKLTRFPIIRNYGRQLDHFDLKLIKKLPWLRRLYWAFTVQVTK